MAERVDFRGVIPKSLAIGQLWPQIAEQVSRSFPHSRDEYTLDDIRDGIAREEIFAAGLVENGRVKFVVTCSVCQFPQKRVLYIQYGAGRGGKSLLPAVIEAAKTLKCDWIETRCRESVSRLYRALGFDCHYVTPILEIPKNET